jgi:hypothetical protein
MATLQDILGGGLPAGLLSPEMQAQAEQRAKSAALTNLGFALLQSSRGQPGQGKPSLGQIIGQAGPVGMQAYQQSFDKTLQDIMMQQKFSEMQKQQQQQQQQQQAIEEYISSLPPDQQARFRAFPQQASEAMFRDPKAAPGVVGEFQAAKASGDIPPETTLPQYIEMKKPPGTTVQNILGGDKLTPAQEAIDKKFAEDYVSWKGGGGQDTAAQIAQLKPVIQALEAGQPITGMKVAVQPDLLLAMTNPKALQSREQVEEVVQRNLRAVLGAQFTEREGERLIARAYNPKLPPEENASRLRRLFLQMSTAAEQKQAMVDHVDQYGTLRGFTGKMPSVQDFYQAIEGNSGKERVLRFNPKTGRVE